MNYQNWSKRKFWGVLIAVFIVGLIIAPKGGSQTKEVVKETPAQCDYSGWQELKSIDDEGFVYCADFARLSSEGFHAASRLDSQELLKITDEMKELNPKINDVAERRQTKLKDLGY